MAEFLVELYVSRSGRDTVALAERRAREAAAALTAEGAPVRFLRSIFVPEDETCFLLFEARSADAVHQAARRAGLAYEHVGETAAGSSIDTRDQSERNRFE